MIKTQQINGLEKQPYEIDVDTLNAGSQVKEQPLTGYSYFTQKPGFV